MKNRLVLILLSCFSFLEAQLEGDFNTSDYIELSNKTYNTIVDLQEFDENSFVALYSSYGYEDGILVHDATVAKFNIDGSVDSTFGENGLAQFTVDGFINIIPKMML